MGRAAVWGMARVLRCLLPCAAASPAGAQLVAELQLQGAAVVLAMLQSCDKKVRGCGFACPPGLPVLCGCSRQCVECGRGGFRADAAVAAWPVYSGHALLVLMLLQQQAPG